MLMVILVLSGEADDFDDETEETLGAPYSNVTCLEIGCYTLNMTDSFGDGWNGNVMTLTTGWLYWEFN